MTCIVGLVHEGVTYIGADSLGSNMFSKVTRNDKKVFKLKDTESAVLGYTTSYRMGQLLMYASGLIDKRDEPNINHEYLVTKFIPNVIRLFDDNGYGRNHSGEKSGGSFLLGYKDKLYCIEEDYQVGESMHEYHAVGCGEYFALGSLHSTKNMKLSPIDRILYALRASSEFSTGVQKPYYILNTANNNVLEFKE